jgi:hypothetical protein
VRPLRALSGTGARCAAPGRAPSATSLRIQQPYPMWLCGSEKGRKQPYVEVKRVISKTGLAQAFAQHHFTLSLLIVCFIQDIFSCHETIMQLII